MNGILPLWKEKGMTSHDAVYKLRKILGTKKVGHTGTLDPSVEGVLPMCIGQATRVAEYITDAGKEYIAVISIGTATETEDADGAAVVSDNSFKKFSRSELEEVLAQLTGEIVQVPPMFSAVKVEGRRLYEYARKGIEVERPSRTVTIDKLEILDDAEYFEGSEVTFRLRIICGKGTYIRTLAVQIGELLGYPAHMASLIRTASGNYRKEDCRTLAEIAELKEQGKLADFIQPLEAALEDFRFFEIEEDMHFDIINGQVLPKHPLFEEDETPIVFTQNSKALAVYQIHPRKPLLMKPEKMFPENS
ncbi:tRNA pseudouridine(55) synthase TruB [Sporosarcina sp. G11-34]|uniref:tRNA pseudouridine(55) synthase TruB n=1 Tax=Sporosarcina sp. G11-34 TaxID=2849605 RepID=UPI0022A96C14|nr:tRNA pseudouridine(55) synthase TruB [Sporosarcina sp. G11-34]MCZ2257019.1 tRNA pseudouridine(55) synthase TruB [Sporosarcina sp. G11-34]